MIKFIPGKMYECIKVIEIKNNFDSIIGTANDYIEVDNSEMAKHGVLNKGDVVLFIADVLIPNVKLYRFLFNNKTILLSSYQEKYHNEILVELKC